jgi:hypothetical protein
MLVCINWYNIKSFHSEIITAQLTKKQAKMLLEHINQSYVKKLDIRKCKETSIIWTKYIKNKLYDLNISDLQSTSKILVQIRNNMNIRTLSLYNCYLNDNDLECIATMQNLSYLNISKNPMITNNGLIHLNKLIKLNKLDIDEMSISDEGLHILSNCKNIKSIMMNLNYMRSLKGKVTDIGLSYLTNLTNLTDLTLNGFNLISDESALILFHGLSAKLKNLTLIGYYGRIKDLVIITNLESLKLKLICKNYIICKEMINLTKLLELDIEIDNYFPRALDLEQSSYLSQITTLQKLRLSGNIHINNSSMHNLTKLINLSELDLLCSSITDETICTLSYISNLKKLSLSFCDKITDKGFNYLIKLVNLENVLLIYEYKFTNYDSIRNLIGIHNLIKFELKHKHQLHYKIYSHIIRIKNYNTLDISGLYIFDEDCDLLSILANSIPNNSVKLTINGGHINNLLKLTNIKNISYLHLINCFDISGSDINDFCDMCPNISRKLVYLCDCQKCKNVEYMCICNYCTSCNAM